MLGFRCPKLFNPSDYFLDILSFDNRTPELDVASTDQVKRLGDLWEDYVSNHTADFSVGKDTKDFTDNQSKEGNAVTFLTHTARSEAEVPLSLGEQWALWFARTYQNFKLLSWRAFSEQLRNTAVLKVKIILSCFFAGLMGAMYNNAGDNQAAILNKTGVMFVIILNQGFNGATGTLNTFPREVSTLSRLLFLVAVFPSL